MARYFLHLAYDGTNYCGWQIQPKVKTVQETIERVLSIFVPNNPRIIGCGRTDTGVHARSYYAHFDTDAPLIEEFVYKMNAVLPPDIAIYECIPVDDSIHARYSATRRRYTYHMHFRKDPFLNTFSTYQAFPLHVDAMNEAAAYLLGSHDFSSFARSQTDVKHNFCEVFSATWTHNDAKMVFTIEANRFLRNMVRAIVGTMSDIGREKYPPEHMKSVIEALDRDAAGKSAYPQGLFLDRITYPQLNNG